MIFFSENVPFPAKFRVSGHLCFGGKKVGKHWLRLLFLEAAAKLKINQTKVGRRVKRCVCVRAMYDNCG